jgi:hypothetical protein
MVEQAEPAAVAVVVKEQAAVQQVALVALVAYLFTTKIKIVSTPEHGSKLLIFL